MLDGLCLCVIVSNTLPGKAFLGLDWWAILMVVQAVGAHGYSKVSQPLPFFLSLFVDAHFCSSLELICLSIR